ncbi:MAG: hypothetical protein RLP44_13250 [Aggregatilineales bacterium]
MEQRKSDCDYVYEVHGCLDRGEFEKAVSTATEGLTHYPEEKSLYRLRAIAHNYLKRYHQAIDDLSKYLEYCSNEEGFVRSSTYASIYAFRGSIRAKLEHYENAINDLTKAIELSKSARDLYDRAGLFLKMNANENAKKDLELIEDMNDSTYSNAARDLLNRLDSS